MKQTPQESIFEVTKCRACLHASFKEWLDLGMQPLANAFLKDRSDYEYRFPLSYMYCTNCELVQTTHTISPELLFRNYLYRSSTSEVFRKHFEALAEKEFNIKNVQEGDLVVDIGSNDGILLKPFNRLGAKVVGVEPAIHIANAAAKDGIETLPEFFDAKIASKIIDDKNTKATIITMTNVFAHIPDLDKIMEGVKYLLRDKGRFMIEVTYLPEMLKYGTFDLLYHEHICSWHLYPLKVFFTRWGMFIDEVELLPVHGGSIRVYTTLGMSRKSTYKLEDRGLPELPHFKEFPYKMEYRKKRITTLLNDLKKLNKKIVGYGAPAKMSTMTNYFDIAQHYISYIIDDAPEKHGLYSPGKHIRISPPPFNYSLGQIDYLFIFAWNFADSIIRKTKARGYKGKYIVPFPKFEVI